MSALVVGIQLGKSVIGFGVNGHQNPQHGRRDQAYADQRDEDHITFISKNAPIALGLGCLYARVDDGFIERFTR